MRTTDVAGNAVRSAARTPALRGPGPRPAGGRAALTKRATRASGTMRLGLRAAVLASTLSAALVVQSPVASADSPSANVFVSHSALPGARDVGCATAAYRSVQDAVNAASDHGKVYLCGRRPFTGPVVIKKNLELTGDHGATLSSNDNPDQPTADHIPAQDFSGPFAGLEPPNAVVAILGDVHVRISGLTVTGRFMNTTCPHRADDFGIIALGSPDAGASVQLDHGTVTGIGSSKQPDCAGLGIGLLVGRYYLPTSDGARVVDFGGHAQVSQSTIDRYQSGGMLVDGASTVHLHASIVRGSGPNPTVAQAGLQISRGATGQLDGNLIAGNEHTGTESTVGFGVYVFGGCTDIPNGGPLDTNLKVAGNHLANNDLGVFVLQGDGNSGCELPTTTPTRAQIVANLITKDDGVTNTAPEIDDYGNCYSGYQAGIQDSGNSDTIAYNAIAGSDGAFGPQVVPLFPPEPPCGSPSSPAPPFLVPIDIQSYPSSNPLVRASTYNGQPTNPPYPGEPGAPEQSLASRLNTVAGQTHAADVGRSLTHLHSGPARHRRSLPGARGTVTVSAGTGAGSPSS
jgi:hypothetical protein